MAVPAFPFALPRVPSRYLHYNDSGMGRKPRTSRPPGGFAVTPWYQRG